MLFYLLHFIKSMACLRVEHLLDCPRKCPEHIPVLVSLRLLPASLLKVLNQRCLIQVCLVLELHLGLLVGISAMAAVEAERRVNMVS